MSRPIYLFSISSHPGAISINSLHVDFFKPNIDLSKYDYLIITSKQATKALMQYKKKDYISKPALCISKQTAASYEEIGGAVLGVGDGYGDNMISRIKEFPVSTKWLYLRAKVIASDFVKMCRGDGYNIEESIVYESYCSKEILEVDIKENPILIFTSPSSLNCFLKRHVIDETADVIVIGETTASSLPNGIKYKISENTSIESCMELACSL